MKEFVISEVKAETAVLVGLVTKTQDEAKTKEYLDELEFLADTAGAVTVKRFTQKVISPNQTTYVGKGKLEEIKQYIKEEEEEDREIGMVIFDDELSAKQIRNIEQELQVKILDRTSLILDIFAMRAQTAAAKTQVELAQYRYMLPRLQRLWTHLERQGGGSGSGGGKGSVGLRGCALPAASGAGFGASSGAGGTDGHPAAVPGAAEAGDCGKGAVRQCGVSGAYFPSADGPELPGCSDGGADAAGRAPSAPAGLRIGHGGGATPTTSAVRIKSTLVTPPVKAVRFVPIEGSRDSAAVCGAPAFLQYGRCRKVR